MVIVEDEYIVRFGIRSMIDWESLGLMVSGEAANGQEALDLIRESPPDILITDIKMPIMDGITLITEVRKFRPHMKIVILSNLEDFQYAKEAIRNGVSEYMIKSDMMPRDLEATLLRVKEAIVEGAPSSENKLMQSVVVEPIVREKRWLELVEGKQLDPVRRQEILESLGLADVKLPLYMLHIAKNEWALSVEEGQALIRTALGEVMTASSESEDVYEAFPDRQGEMNVLLFERRMAVPGKDEVRLMAQAVRQYLKNHYSISCTIGVSSPTSSCSELHQAYEQATAAAKYKMFIGSERPILYGVDYVPASSQLADNIKVSTTHIHSMVYAFQTKELHAYLEDIFEQLTARKDYDIVEIISLELLILLTTLWSEVASDQQRILQLKKQYYEQLSKLETIQMSKSWFLQAFEALIAHMVGIYNSDRNGIIKAAQYMQQYYQQEISLQSISNLVHLSKNYFANLFKKEMGESFLEHLTRIRIEKAKALLTSELKTADIGHLVGIPDPKYFSKVFKKITGSSPSEYRNRVRGDN
ncbi:response regulator [Paenibacillus pectinilyticus]|uniref:response regulator n=1 Tax=Paenibacillus pectinilyticus TaxID=512399 RepID=UPI001FC9286B|nr:response regulator [Paenibacillus pectinilyticus]